MRFSGENERSQNNLKVPSLFFREEVSLDGLTVYKYLPSYASDTFTDSVVMALKM